MPIYTFTCPSCGLEFEGICSWMERDTGVACPKCKTVSKWRGVDAASTPKDRGSMGAILSNGDRVSGHFGKEAVRRRKRG